MITLSKCLGALSALTLLMAAARGNLPDNPEEYAAWKEKTLAEIKSSVASRTDRSIPRLTELMLKLSQEQSPNLERDEERPVFHAAQTALISLPDHAEYFERQIAEARAKTSDPWHDQNYHDTYYATAKMLAMLPSPETLGVAGRLLESAQDLPSKEEKIEILKAGNRGATSFFACPAEMGASVLQALHVRGEEDAKTASSGYLVYWRNWWNEVKSGRKAFSFKGQNVEYRFEPDGTWKSTPLNLTKEQLQTETMSKSTSDKAKLPAPLYSTQLALPAISNRWYWLGSSAVFLCILAWWAIHKRPTAS